MVSSPLSLEVWAQAYEILAAFSAIRPCEFAHRMGAVDYKTAYLMRRRILEDVATLKKVRSVMTEQEMVA